MIAVREIDNRYSKMINKFSETTLETGVAEFNSDTIHYLPPQTSEYIKALTQNGPSTYIDNALVEMKVITIDGIVLPIVISHPKRINAETCSLHSHYVRYTLEELIKRNRKISKWFFKVLVGSFGLALKVCEIDRVVYINNWLFATNPHRRLSARQIHQITSYLQKRYPRRAIIYRTINPYLHKYCYDALLENGYRMIKSRLIYLLDPKSGEFLNRTNAKIDMQLLKHTPYDIVSGKNILNNDVPRLAELYRSLYLDKHCYLNPQLNVSFFSLTIRKEIFEYRALKKNGRIDAFTSFFVRDGVLVGAFVGYDRRLPEKLGLYRQATAILISEAKNRGLLLNLSAGVGAFKKLRGAFPIVEYDAIFDHHLPRRRRLASWLIEKEGEAWGLGL